MTTKEDITTGILMETYNVDLTRFEWERVLTALADAPRDGIVHKLSAIITMQVEGQNKP